MQATFLVGVLAVSLFSLVPRVLAGQQVTGKVFDATSGRPLADASVVLLDKAGTIVRGTLTEPDGSFALIAPQPGSCTLRVGGSGFETWNSPPVELREGASVNLDVRLFREGGSSALAVFHQRRALGEGVFLTEEEISARGGSRFTDLLLNVESVRIVALPNDTNYLTVRLFGSRVEGREVGARQRLEPGSDCPPVLFVDGRWWGSVDEAGATGPDLAFLPSTLVGIEIYTPTLVPAALKSGRDAEFCGVIGVWRRESSAGRRR